MSFVALGGDGSARPSFFELVAAERLMPSLKAAVLYSLSVYALRRPGLNRLLDQEEELFFLISILLDRQALRGPAPASFAESLYGLKRMPAPGHSMGSASGDASGGSSSDGGGGGGGGGGSARIGAARQQPLSYSQRRMSLILLTLGPYIRAKLDALYRRQLEQQQGPLGLTLSRQPLQQQQQQHQQHQQQRGGQRPAQQPGAALAAWAPRLRALALRAFLQAYPWVHAAHEGARFAYQLLYLLDLTPYYSPGLHLLGLTVARVSGGELAEGQREQAARRGARLAAARRPGSLSPLGLLREARLRLGYLVSDHTRSTLILSAFAFKLLEWWYTSAEQKLGGQQALPPPPPPPAPKPAWDGVPLPADVTLCPLCKRPRTNPAMVATSGYSFCYPCAYRWVAERGCCPVTQIPAGVEHVRRLYQGV